MDLHLEGGTVRSNKRAVALDFAQPRGRILSLSAGGEPVAFDFADGHILIPAAATRAG